jgi:hypothetical protein
MYTVKPEGQYHYYTFYKKSFIETYLNEANKLPPITTGYFLNNQVLEFYCFAPVLTASFFGIQVAAF